MMLLVAADLRITPKREEIDYLTGYDPSDINDRVTRRSVTGAEELNIVLESLALRQSKNTLALCLIDPVQTGALSTMTYFEQIRSLVCYYPEVTFRFIEVGLAETRTDSNKQDYSFVPHCPRVFVRPEAQNTGPKDPVSSNIRRDILEQKRRFIKLGQRDIFDPFGLRVALRLGLWGDAHTTEEQTVSAALEALRKRQYAFILETEEEYRDLLGYCAFRSGKYKIRSIRIQSTPADTPSAFRFAETLKLEGDDDLKQNDSKVGPGDVEKESKGVLIHPWDIRDWKDSCSRKSYEDLPGLRLKRMLVTGAGAKEVETKPPKKWPLAEEQWIAWKERKRGKVPELRGLSKPLGWIHDIRSDGLLPAWTQEDHTEWTFLDCIGTPVQVSNDGHHAAPPQTLEMAQHLLRRAQDALKADEVLLACVFSLEAIRWLRGHSSTLSSDAIQCLYEAETELELRFGSSGSSSRSDAPKRRKNELEVLLERLKQNGWMPERQAPEVKERVWAALRKRYNEAGAFEPADEALNFIHEAQKERVGLTGKPVSAFLGWYKPCTSVGMALLVLIGFILAATDFAAPLVRFPGEEPPSVTLLHWSVRLPNWTPWVIPCLVLAGLALIWIRAWPKAALHPTVWARTVLWSILFLSAGNFALLSNPSPVNSITDHRGTAYAESVAWTCGGALAQSLADRFLNGFIAQPENHASIESLSFGWRGRTKANSNDPDLGANPDTQFPRTMLWLENVVAGWLSFAMVLSTIYRKAARG